MIRGIVRERELTRKSGFPRWRGKSRSCVYVVTGISRGAEPYGRGNAAEMSGDETICVYMWDEVCLMKTVRSHACRHLRIAAGRSSRIRREVDCGNAPGAGCGRSALR